MTHYKLLRLMVFGLFLAACIPFATAQRDLSRARGLVAQTHHDLRGIAHHETYSGKERERYDNALRHLSEFDRELAKGKYDKDRLDAAIDDINNVCKNNALGPNERDALLGDLKSLRDLRAEWR
ncbi:MAG: hypothetical protein ACREMY_07725 [bacterium]